MPITDPIVVYSIGFFEGFFDKNGIKITIENKAVIWNPTAMSNNMPALIKDLRDRSLLSTV